MLSASLYVHIFCKITIYVTDAIANCMIYSLQYRNFCVIYAFNFTGFSFYHITLSTLMSAFCSFRHVSIIYANYATPKRTRFDIILRLYQQKPSRFLRDTKH